MHAYIYLHSLGQIYTGMKNGVVQAVNLDLTVFYKCEVGHKVLYLGSATLVSFPDPHPALISLTV